MRTRLVLLFTVLVLAAAGCSSAAGDGGSPPSGSSAPTASASGFPASVDTVNGQVTIEQQPDRVVLLNDQLVETAAALGITPAGAPAPTTPLGPWADGTIDADTAAFSLPMADGIPMEKVAATEPDLIVAHDYQITGDAYSKLSALAPTLVLPVNSEAPAPPTWRNDLHTIAAATGRSATADQISADIAARIDRVQQQHPRLDDATFQLGNFLSNSEFVCTNSASTSSARFLSSLGLELATIPGAGSDARAVLSRENFTALNDIDLVIMGASDPDLAEQLEEDPIFAQLTPVQQQTANVVDLTWVTAYNIPTALSIPYLLDDLEPYLERL